MRRLPVYLLLDTSGSMRGEPIEAVNVGLRSMISALRQDPHALETVHISIITFDAEAKAVVPLTPLEELSLPEITTPQSGPTHLGLALRVALERMAKEVIRSTPSTKGDWMPLLFVMTDGSPSDAALYEEQVSRVQAAGFGNIIACAAGPKAKSDSLLRLTANVVSLDTMDSASFSSFFRWVSSAVSGGSRSLGVASEVSLPPPPPELQVVA